MTSGLELGAFWILTVDAIESTVGITAGSLQHVAIFTPPITAAFLMLRGLHQFAGNAIRGTAGPSDPAARSNCWWLSGKRAEASPQCLDEETQHLLITCVISSATITGSMIDAKVNKRRSAGSRHNRSGY